MLTTIFIVKNFLINKKLMKKLLLLSTFLVVGKISIFAQKKTSEKVADATEKVTQKIDNAKEKVKQVSTHVQAIIKIFEPFFGKKNKSNTDSTTQVESSNTQTDANNSQGDANNNQSQGNIDTYATDNGINYNNQSNYNADGIANVGTQNSNEYGNYISIGSGMIYDEIDAASQSANIDLIFTATNWGGKTLYALFSPYYAKSNTKASLYNYGIKFKRNDPHPAKKWDRVNESEVALTNITSKQFDKIQTNPQLESVVKGISKFSGALEITDGKMEGKVFAIKTVMGDRTCYGLLYVLNQYGTTGENSYLKVKLKVTGFDANGDGNPDASLYHH